jgi:transposase
MQFFVGLDWAAREHAVCVVDERGSMTARFTIEHSVAGMAELVRRLGKVAPAAELRVAIERPTGLVVDTLVDCGFCVVPIHPNAVKATRSRYSAAQGKTDLGDAYLLADVLRTDGHRFRALVPLSDETKALRGLVRTRDDLVAQRTALANQLRCMLGEFWPGGGAIFADVDSPIALDFLSPCRRTP